MTKTARASAKRRSRAGASPTPAAEVKFAEVGLRSVEADGSFIGYASLFDAPDLAGDVVAPGAFADSLARRGPDGVRMLFQHDPAEPIGVWTGLREDDRGLLATGQLTLDASRGREVLSLMRAGALDGLSIGFTTRKSRRDPKTGLRRLIEVDLWEISVVTFPLLPQARVGAVKSARGRLPTTREFERWLTRDAGFSRAEARTVIAAGFRTLKAQRDAGRPYANDVAAAIRRAAAALAPR